MSKDCESHYKISRINAGIKQEEAAHLLNVASRSLSDYENRHRAVPDDVVAKMAEVYNCPLLAWWHLKEFSVLGKFLPDVQMPTTKSDMAFQLWQAKKDLPPAVDAAMELLRGDLCEVKGESLNDEINKIAQVEAMLMSTVLYSKKLLGRGNPSVD